MGEPARPPRGPHPPVPMCEVERNKRAHVAMIRGRPRPSRSWVSVLECPRCGSRTERMATLKAFLFCDGATPWRLVPAGGPMGDNQPPFDPLHPTPDQEADMLQGYLDGLADKPPSRESLAYAHGRRNGVNDKARTADPEQRELAARRARELRGGRRGG